MISVKKISKSFGNLQVLGGVDFFVQKAKILSILGPSGSGKSTLLRCIAGLENSYEGEVTIDGISQDRYLSKNRIAFVPQAYSNFPWLRVSKNIRLGYRNRKVDSEEENVKRLIVDLQLEGFEDFFPNQLSGGMQQRVAIGRALAQGTDILAMDEPFGALDYQTRLSLQLLIKELNAKYHKTVLFVTHDIEEAIFISDRIIILSKLPSVIVKEYHVPSTVKQSTSEDIRYGSEFIQLRKAIEKELKNLD